MCNCLKTPTSRFRKLFASLFVFAGLCTGAWAATCYWIGGATDLSGNPDNNWSTLANWTTAIDGTGTTPASVPGTGDTAYFPKAATVILDSPITVAELRIPNPNLETASFEVELTGDALTVTSVIETVRAAAAGAADDATSTLTFNCNVSSPSLIMHSGGNITIGTGKTASITNIENQGGADPATLLKVSGNLTSTSIQLSNVSSRTLLIDGGTVTTTTLTGSNGSVTNNGALSISDISNSNINTINGNGSGTIELAGDSAYIWTGADATNPTAWSVAANWQGGVPPDDAENITIRNVANLPVISTTVQIKEITFETGAKLKVTGTFAINNTASNFDISQYIDNTSTGTIQTNGTLKVSTAYNAPSLSLECKTIQTTAQLTANSLEITDATEFQANVNVSSFIATNSNLGGKTITLTSADISATSISISGSGAGAGSRLELAGSGKIKPTTSLTASNLSIGANVVLDGYTISTPLTGCEPTAGTSDSDYWTVLQNHWLIQDLSNYEFVWKDSPSNNSWNNPANWNTGYVPVTDCKITIPSTTTTMPVISAACAGGTLSIASDASVQLGANALTLSGTENGTSATILTNEGTIIYTAAGRITNSSSTSINDVTQGTVKYDASGTGDIEDFDTGTGDDYYNLVVEGNQKWNFAGSVIKIKNSISIASGAICKVTENTTLQAPVTGFDFQGSFTATTKNITLTPYNDSDDFIIPAGMQSKFEFTGSNKGWVYIGSDSYTGTIKFNTAVNGTATGTYFPYKLRFKSNVELNADIRVTNSIWAEKNISGDGILTFGGSGNQTFTTTDTFTYNKIAVNKNGGSLSLTSNGTINNLSITAGITTTFTGTPTITAFSAAAAAGDIVFSKGGNITNTNNETIATTGNVTIDSSTTAMSVTGTYNQTAGTTTVKGANISAANFNAANLVAGANATITTSGGAQTYGAISGTTTTTPTENLMLVASTVTFNGDAGAPSLNTLTVNADIAIGTVPESVELLANQINFSGDISGTDKKLLLNTATLNSTKTSAVSIAVNELELKRNLSLTSTNAITLTTPKISGTGFTLSNGTSLSLASEITAAPAIINTGAITCSNAAVFNGAYSGTGNLSLSSGNTTFANDVDLSQAGTFNPSTGTVILSAESKGGTAANFTGPQTFNTLKITGNVNIAGNNNFTSLVANELGGKTITFAPNSTQSAGSITLTGTSTQPLTLSSTGNWNLSCTSEPTLQYLSVTNSTNSSSPAKNFVALNSTDAGGNVDWCFPNMPYKWTGGTSDVWTNTANWDNNVVPTKGANVEIAAGTYYPVLTAGLNLNTSLGPTPYNGIITVDSGATFDISNQTVTAGGIVNNGTVRLKGVANQIAVTEPISNGTATSTVWYYDDSTTLGATTLAWGTSYKKLIINKPANLDSTALNVSDTTTISAGTGNTVSLNNSSNIFAGHVTIGNSAATPTVNAGAVTLNGTGTSDAAIYLENNVLADSLTLNSNVQGGNLTITGPVTVNTASVSTTGSQTYNNTVSLLTATTFTAGTSVTFNANVNGSNSITVSAPLNIHCAQITTSGDQTYSGAVALDANTSLSSGGDILFSSAITETGTHTLTLTQASSTTFDGAVQITGIADDTAHNGTITFNAGGTISNTVTFNTPQEVTFGNESTDEITFNSELIHTTGTTSLTGKLNAANISLGNLSAQGTITSSGSQAYTGTVYLTGDLVLSSTATSTAGITFSSTINGAHNLTISTNTGTNGTVFNGTVGATNALSTLSVAGPTTFHCTSITSTGNQTYDGAVTVQTNTTLTANAGQLIYFKNTITGTGSTPPTVTTQYANSQFDGAISSLTSLTTAVTTTFNTNANISSVGTLSTNAANINCTSISTSGNQTYGGAVALGASPSLTSGGNISFASTVTGTHTLTLTQASSTTFDGVVQLTGIADATTHTGAVTFNANTTISNPATFNTTNTVTFGNGTEDTITFGTYPNYANLTHTAGPTSITGTVIGADITLGDTTGGPITITTPGIFHLADGKTLSYTTSFTQNGTGNSILSGSFGSASGSGSASFGTSAVPTNVQLTPTTTANFGNTNDTINISGNLIHSKGTVTVKANVNIAKDFLIFGNSYNETDSTTSVTDEYSYKAQRPSTAASTWSQRQYTSDTLPDGTAISTASSWSAILKVDSGKTITVGKNFYANGTTLSETAGSGIWYLKVPDLTNPANGFAEAYFSTITRCNLTTDATSDALGPKARLVTLECTDGGSNTNVDFGDFEIVQAYTVRDNVIYVEFNRPVRYHSATVSLLKFNNASASPACSFTGLYADPDCQTELNYDTQLSYFYIKAAPQNSASLGAWNTDATGKDAGTAKSSDRYGIHHNTLPVLDFPRSLQSTTGSSTISFIITDRWGKRLNNYSKRNDTSGQIPLTTAEPAYGSTASTHNVEDKTGPVLWTVRTGQELHDAYDSAVGETSQHSYDSHNFLEFRYSEPVDIGSITAYSAGTTPNIVENIQVTDTLGAITGNTTTAANELTFAGLARFTASASGAGTLQLYTGSDGNANKYMNAFYRVDEYSIRLSVAGWTDGTVADYSGNDYKKWPGYIEIATQFTGAIAHTVAAANNLVKDQSGNTQVEYAANKAEPQVYSNSTDSDTSALLPVSPVDVYSAWDISSPVFTPLRFSNDTTWGDQTMAEAIGNTNGSGSTLDRIDFHFFDNTPTYTGTDSAEWYTEIGWCAPGTDASKTNLLDANYTYCADIIGGARQFDTNAARRTTGGIRFSTKAEISTAFTYSDSPNNPSPSSPFLTGIGNVHTTVVSQLFTGSSAPMRPANDPDGLYLGLTLSDTNLSVETTFAFSYNEYAGYLTDLAGNRLRSTTSKTIDRTPPSFDVILSPVDSKSVYIIFVKQLVTDSSKIKFRTNAGANIPIADTFETLMPKCFRIITIDENGNASVSEKNQIDETVPAQIVESNTNDSFTCIKLTTKNDITIDDVKNMYIQLIMPSEYPTQTLDPLTSNINSRVTFIQDLLGNYMSLYGAHALSDFAINYVNPLYAYSTDMTTDEMSVMNGLYEEGSWAVHDWNADQQNYGTLPANHPVSIVADTKGNANVRVYLSPSPDEGSVADQFNKDFDASLRVWLPNLIDGSFRAFAANNNDNYSSSDGALLNSDSSNAIFNISADVARRWESGSQVTFLFGLLTEDSTPLRIYNNPYYNVATDRFDYSLSGSVPLYSLRMTDINEINSLDLWSFKLKSITNQRGGVTILNNVINATKGEHVVVKVDVPEDGKLSVIVMTLDGNIISYLNRGKVEAGENYFTWDGKNKNGNSVARGMYFIRVTGTDIDETRKVMVVKDN